LNSTFVTITTQLEGWLVLWLGAGLNDTVMGSITRADIAVSLLYLLAAAIISLLAAANLRHRSSPGVSSESQNALNRHVLAALRKPLHVLIWIFGLYIAATPLLARLRPERDVSAVEQAMDLTFKLGAASALFWFMFRATRIVEARLAKWTATTPSKLDDLLVPLLGTALRVMLLVIATMLAVPLLGLPAAAAGVVGKLTSIALILAVAALLFRSVSISQRLVLSRFDINLADNLRARQVYTQIHVISRIVYIVIGVFTVSAVLMLFQEVRHLGTSLLASAGIVGIIAGLAAQKTLSNLFAGFQIALAQPVRQDDVVVVEGEWGRVEEITLSFIVVHIWDDRRLVLPLSYFIEKPFQNWTRTSAAITGSVFVWVDYSFPVEQGRQALKAIIESNPLWDKRFWNLQVSDASEKTIQLRILATSSDSSRSWDLRCAIREQFIAYVQSNHPDALPHFRAEVLEHGRGEPGVAP
jgi:small-conductance mechanosensitive channel